MATWLSAELLEADGADTKPIEIVGRQVLFGDTSYQKACLVPSREGIAHQAINHIVRQATSNARRLERSKRA